ncbi:hypothetical protein K7X08_017258 [Anisodus acutangulus]|uniref:Uncharacterized protein n=1 Tax=Anisodus acutangulus TaxID=402998 RepID=A0A9Q1LXC3_9SOLA|nr:hypothetical protein K7X08_017258 [Anisodus acutangulus]
MEANLDIVQGQLAYSEASRARLRSRCEKLQCLRAADKHSASLLRDLAVIESHRDAFKETLENKLDLSSALTEAEVDIAAANSMMEDLQDS